MCSCVDKGRRVRGRCSVEISSQKQHEINIKSCICWCLLMMIDIEREKKSRENHWVIINTTLTPPPSSFVPHSLDLKCQKIKISHCCKNCSRIECGVRRSKWGLFYFDKITQSSSKISWLYEIKHFRCPHASARGPSHAIAFYFRWHDNFHEFFIFNWIAPSAELICCCPPHSALFLN